MAPASFVSLRYVVRCTDCCRNATVLWHLSEQGHGPTVVDWGVHRGGGGSVFNDSPARGCLGVSAAVHTVVDAWVPSWPLASSGRVVGDQ